MTLASGSATRRCSSVLGDCSAVARLRTEPISSGPLGRSTSGAASPMRATSARSSASTTARLLSLASWSASSEERPRSCVSASTSISRSFLRSLRNAFSSSVRAGGGGIAMRSASTADIGELAAIALLPVLCMDMGDGTVDMGEPCGLTPAGDVAREVTGVTKRLLLALPPALPPALPRPPPPTSLFFPTAPRCRTAANGKTLPAELLLPVGWLPPCLALEPFARLKDDFRLAILHTRVGTTPVSSGYQREAACSARRPRYSSTRACQHQDMSIWRRGVHMIAASRSAADRHGRAG